MKLIVLFFVALVVATSAHADETDNRLRIALDGDNLVLTVGDRFGMGCARNEKIFLHDFTCSVDRKAGETCPVVSFKAACEPADQRISQR